MHIEEEREETEEGTDSREEKTRHDKARREQEMEGARAVEEGGGGKDQTKEPKTKDLRKGPADGKRQKSKLNHVGLLFVRVSFIRSFSKANNPNMAPRSNNKVEPSTSNKTACAMLYPMHALFIADLLQLIRGKKRLRTCGRACWCDDIFTI